MEEANGELEERTSPGKVRDDEMRAREYIRARVVKKGGKLRECVSREPQIRADENTSRASRN